MVSSVKGKAKSNSGSFGGSVKEVQTLKENKSKELYEKIKSANTNKKKLATIFTFTK